MIDEKGRLRRIDYGDRVFFDSVRGIAGTTYPIGTAEMPSSVIADVITICGVRNLNCIEARGVLTLGAAMVGYSFQGLYFESLADYLDLSDEDVSGSRFEDIVVTGGQGGAGLATYVRCILYVMTGFRGLAENCPIYGNIALATGGADYADFDACSSIHDTCTMTVGDPDRLSVKDWKGNLTLSAQTDGLAFMRGFDGDLIVDGMTGGELNIFMRDGTVTINANCTGGTINIYGDARVTDNHGAGCTVNDYGSSGYGELSATGATTGAAYIDALDIDARLYNEFTIKIKNTDGANSLDYRVLLRPESGVAEQMIQPEDITLAFGDYDFVNIDHKWGQVIVQVRDTAAPNHADFSVYAIANKN